VLDKARYANQSKVHILSNCKGEFGSANHIQDNDSYIYVKLRLLIDVTSLKVPLQSTTESCLLIIIIIIIIVIVIVIIIIIIIVIIIVIIPAVTNIIVNFKLKQ